MKSTVVPNPLVVVSLFIISLALLGVYVTGRLQGNREIKALEAQYAAEDKAAAEAVAKLSKELKDQCQAEKEFILNNMQGK